MYYIIEGELSGATEKTFGAKAPDAQARRRHWTALSLITPLFNVTLINQSNCPSKKRTPIISTLFYIFLNSPCSCKTTDLFVSLQLSQKSLLISNNVKYSFLITVSYFKFTYLFFFLFFYISGDYEAAISEHQQELSLSEVVNDVIGRAVANRKIGECYAEMGNIEAALKVSKVLCFVQNDR